MVTVTIGQGNLGHDGLNVFGHIATGAAIGVATEGHFAGEFTPVHLVRADTFFHLCHLVQAHDANTAIRSLTDIEGQAFQVLGCGAQLGVEAHQDVISLIVAGSPNTDALACHQGAQLVRDAAHTQTKISSGFTLDADVHRGLVGFDAGVHVDQTGHVLDLGHDQASQAFQLGLIGAEQIKLDLLGAAHRIEQAHMRDGQARHVAQTLADFRCEVVDVEAAQMPVQHPEIHVRVNLAVGVAGVDGAEGVAHLGEAAQHGLDFFGFGFSDFDGRTHGHIEGHRGFRVVGFGHELGAQHGHHEDAAHKNGQSHQHGHQTMMQSFCQQALVDISQPVGAVFEPSGDASQAAVIKTRLAFGLPVNMDAGVVPDTGEHRVEGEADKHGNHHRSHDGQTKLVEELANHTVHETDGQKHRHDGEGGGQHCQTNFTRTVHRRVEGGLAHLHMAHDVLAHHDGVVNQQANAQ